MNDPIFQGVMIGFVIVVGVEFLRGLREGLKKPPHA